MATDLISKIKEFFKKETSSVSADDYEKLKKEVADTISYYSALDKESLPDVPEYERMTYNALSDEEIEGAAKNSLAEYKNLGLNAIESEVNGLNKKYESDKAAAEKAATESKAATEKAYEAARENTSNDSLKRGLARSSIAINKQAQLNESEAGDVSKIMTALNEDLSALDSEISALSLKREKALNDFNIAYASKLTTKINDLKSEREAKETEVLKYNNSLSEKEHSQSVNKQMNESSLYSAALTQKQKEDDLKGTNDYYNHAYNELRGILLKMKPAEARDAIANDPFIRANLNSSLYYKLYDEFCRY